jgi:hypothetical protein
MARLLVVGDITLVDNQNMACGEEGREEFVPFAILFQCDSAEELKKIVQNAGTLVVTFNDQPVPSDE